MKPVRLVWRAPDYMPSGSSRWLCDARRVTKDGLARTRHPIAASIPNCGYWVVFTCQRVCGKKLTYKNSPIPLEEPGILTASKEVARQLREQGLKVTIKRVSCRYKK